MDLLYTFLWMIFTYAAHNDHQAATHVFLPMTAGRPADQTHKHVMIKKFWNQQLGDSVDHCQSYIQNPRSAFCWRNCCFASIGYARSSASPAVTRTPPSSMQFESNSESRTISSASSIHGLEMSSDGHLVGSNKIIRYSYYRWHMP